MSSCIGLDSAILSHCCSSKASCSSSNRGRLFVCFAISPHNRQLCNIPTAVTLRPTILMVMMLRLIVAQYYVNNHNSLLLMKAKLLGFGCDHLAVASSTSRGMRSCACSWLNALSLCCCFPAQKHNKRPTIFSRHLEAMSDDEDYDSPVEESETEGKTDGLANTMLGILQQDTKSKVSPIPRLQQP